MVQNAAKSSTLPFARRLGVSLSPRPGTAPSPLRGPPQGLGWCLPLWRPRGSPNTGRRVTENWSYSSSGAEVQAGSWKAVKTVSAEARLGEGRRRVDPEVRRKPWITKFFLAASDGPSAGHRGIAAKRERHPRRSGRQQRGSDGCRHAMDRSTGLGRSSELVAFLRCNASLPDPLMQRMVQMICRELLNR